MEMGGLPSRAETGREMKLTLSFKGFDLASSHGFEIGVSN
jgi:hypothetical protein